jgi:hypothetical protein
MREREQHYWVKSNITESEDVWEVGWLDVNGNWWVFGISGWFDESQLIEVGDMIERPS